MKNLQELEEILGYAFKDKKLLRQALTHSSYSPRLSDNYERLEFLGDRVLGLTIAALLYRMFPDEPEGSLSQRHTGSVNIEIDEDEWNGLEVGPEDTVEIRGEVDKGWTTLEIDVDRISKVNP